MRTLFATAPGGLEGLLQSELVALGANDAKITSGGVLFVASDEIMYECLLWSRFASRILLLISEFDIDNDIDLYHKVNQINWPAIFDPDASFLVHFKGTNAAIRHTQYGALKVKDAIVDCFMHAMQRRPSIEKGSPDIRIVVNLQKKHAVLFLDLSGTSLNQRNYRLQTGEAPLKENLAAAIVHRSGWKPGELLIDPLCGSGTLLIEAAMQAADIAPGLFREHYGFKAWKEFNVGVWLATLSAAEEKRARAKKAIKGCFFGYDKDQHVIGIAKANAERAGVSEFIDFKRQDISQLKNPAPKCTGVLLTNPPYGQRLESEPALIALYTLLGDIVKKTFPGWCFSVFSGSPTLLHQLHLRAKRDYKVKNGPIDCIQKNYEIATHVHQTLNEVSPSTPLTAACDFANRLKKNNQKLTKWAKKEGIECYRLYDADLPDYNVAIDRYKDKVVIQEYAPPKTIDTKIAQQRLRDLINATLHTLGLTADKIILKKREKQKGKQQYQQLSQQKDFFLVEEYGVKFWVNLTDYLDTGLFLDHRLVRKMISDLVKNKRFLNLFGYTASATVYAALAGAKDTTTVDMSKTYLDWAARNLQANGLIGGEHRLVHADCLHYLRECKECFDVIFFDPPTFSNSKRMHETLDIQRDHLRLLTELKRLLKRDGIIIFSNNKQGFKLDEVGLTRLGLRFTDVTKQTVSPDFARNKQIHYCFLLHHE